MSFLLSVSLPPEFSFFDPSEPQCKEILQDPNTTIPELFAVLRQWVPQVQKNIDVIGIEVTIVVLMLSFSVAALILQWFFQPTSKCKLPDQSQIHIVELWCFLFFFTGSLNCLVRILKATSLLYINTT